MSEAYSDDPSDPGETHDSAAQRLIREILGGSLTGGGVSQVYGAHIDSGDRKIVPIAKIGSTFGFGSGAGGRPGNDGEGGGGGGRINVQPLGYLEITEAGSKFKPVYDVTKLGILAILGGTLVLLAIIRRS